MLRRFWDSREGGLAKAAYAIGIGAFLVASTIAGMALIFHAIAEVLT